jgi:DNA modification methylase
MTTDEQTGAVYLRTADIPLDELTPFPGNAKRGDVATIQASLRKNGQYRSLVVREIPDGPLIVLAGNHTLQALQAEGATQARCEIVLCDDATARRINLVDNRAAELGEYDSDALAELLSYMDGDYDGTGYTEEDVDALINVEELPPALEDPDAVPEPPADPASKAGDIWILGPHRLICGDSTSVDTIESLMGKQGKADLILTDPPYGMSYDGGRGKQGGTGFEMIQNDDLAGDNLIHLVRDALVAARTVSKPDIPHYVFFTWRTYNDFSAALRQASLEVKSCIVWDKGSIGLSHGHYRPQHEFCFYVPGGDRWYGDRAQSDIWTISRDRAGNYDHPTQKPVELLAKALQNSSKAGDIVIDCFGGSGSTLIAAHTTGRVARLVELDPRYVDVICRRYQQATGTQPVLASTGQPHDFTTEPVNP